MSLALLSANEPRYKPKWPHYKPKVHGRFEHRELRSYRGHREMPQRARSCAHSHSETKPHVHRKKREVFKVMTNGRRFLPPCHPPHIAFSELAGAKGEKKHLSLQQIPATPLVLDRI